MASSKREEERNEKIIRGLMKLPPNRRCINCTNLGPQYVCTNFWTFVCMICSGIHREFTHRVKSVSLSKFTSQEVEALQNGGNQRAREIYLKDWDLQRQRVPSSSNADKVREFIKDVYVERKYAGGNKSEKPPSDMQSHNTGDDIRRASSYHSYSQSPPYDFQYEERVKRNQGGSLTRKSVFDRGLFERKTASFIYSPGRFSDHIYEDGFTNVESSSRVSDYSASSGGDPSRSDPQSPNFQKNDGFSNPKIDSPREIDDGSQLRKTSSNPEANAKRDANINSVPHPQRTVSAGSFGSFDSSPVSRQLVDSGGLFDALSEPNQSSSTTQNAASMFPSFSQSPTGNFADFDLFKNTSDSSVLSHSISDPQISPSLSYSNELSNKPAFANINQKLPEPSVPSDEGWATFDLPQPSVSITNSQSATVSTAHSGGGVSLTHMNSVSNSNMETQWANFQTTTVHESSSSVSNPWHESLQNVDVPTSGQLWKAFEEYNDQDHCMDMQLGTGYQDYHANPSSTTNQDLDLENPEGFNVDGFQTPVSSGPSFNPPIFPLMGGITQNGQKSGNPFDIDSELEASNAFLDLSTLQSALPSMPIPSYVSGLNESWFRSSSVAYQGDMSYMPVQATSSQLPNVQAPGTVASIGGNPFA